jgi:hypothetical protein
MRLILLFCIATLAGPTQLAGQVDPVSVWPIDSGTRVRIVSPVLGARPATGRVVSTNPDTLFFRWDKRSVSTAIATPSITRLEVARGTHTTKAKSSLVGFFLGAVTGAAIGAASYKPSCNGFCFDLGPSAVAAFGAVVGGGGGAIVGALVGRRKTETWVPVVVPSR